MDKKIKNILLWGGAFVAYRFYKLYELSTSIIYKPVGLSFVRGKTINDFIVRVKVEILNPQNTILELRGIDGTLILHNQVVGTFTSDRFKIAGGLNYFYLDFKVNAISVGAELIAAILNKKVPVLWVNMNIKLPFFSVKQKFAVNPATVPQTETFVQ